MVQPPYADSRGVAPVLPSHSTPYDARHRPDNQHHPAEPSHHENALKPPIPERTEPSSHRHSDHRSRSGRRSHSLSRPPLTGSRAAGDTAEPSQPRTDHCSPRGRSRSRSPRSRRNRSRSRDRESNNRQSQPRRRSRSRHSRPSEHREHNAHRLSHDERDGSRSRYRPTYHKSSGGSSMRA